MSAIEQSVYIGRDWIVYAGPGGFERSEMLAPCLILGPAGASLRITADGGQAVAAPALLHAASVWSAAEGNGLVILYFDPVSPAGVMVQGALRQARLLAWEAAAALLPDRGLFDALCVGRATPGSVQQWVAQCVAVLASTLAPGEVDARMIEIARRLDGEFAGRLDLAALSRAVNLSPDHVRQRFKKQVGITLSRYKAWRQVVAMLASASQLSDDSRPEQRRQAALQAGFYDEPHGYKMLRRYFGRYRALFSRPLQIVSCTDH
ncbi:hypothetical protein [Chitinimonas sp.]|uniref:helix-turn-helix transcriptional regulator n=1 Tax=Chitinimonas sp. TaxID=1934313 RepID=UPI0035B41968